MSERTRIIVLGILLVLSLVLLYVATSNWGQLRVSP